MNFVSACVQMLPNALKYIHAFCPPATLLCRRTEPHAIATLRAPSAALLIKLSHATPEGLRCAAPRRVPSRFIYNLEVHHSAAQSGGGARTYCRAAPRRSSCARTRRRGASLSAFQCRAPAAAEARTGTAAGDVGAEGGVLAPGSAVRNVRQLRGSAARGTRRCQARTGRFFQFWKRRTALGAVPCCTRCSLTPAIMACEFQACESLTLQLVRGSATA